MTKNPFAKFDFSNPFETRRSRNLFGYHTTPRDFKHGARDIPFGMGAMSLYVDGTDGHDSNDGESWKTAVKTIQEAVDRADSWTNIFIRSATYAENVIIPAGKDGIELYGEKESSVVVIPATGSAISIAADRCGVHSLTAIGNGATAAGILFSGYTAHDLVAINSTVGNQNADGIGFENHGNYTNIDFIKCSSTYKPSVGIYLYVSKKTVVKNCYLDYCKTALQMQGSDNCKIYNNTFVNATTKGCSVTGNKNSVYHNNFVNNTVQISTTSVSTILENYYDDHTNINNGHGIATEPYAFTSGEDLSPVVAFNGWNSLSIKRTLLRKKTAGQATAGTTTANGTAWVTIETIAPTTADIELYRIKMTAVGTWAGTPMYRIIIGTTKVYPFDSDSVINSGVVEDFVFAIPIQINETCKIQFRSTDAGDGAGETVMLDALDYARVL